MMDVIGPHKSLSFWDGVIQFKDVLNACIAIAAYAVQPAQLGTSPAADVMLAPIQINIGTDNKAATRPVTGRGPS